MKEGRLKICLIAKYPPIEGGESSKAYWLARVLGERGHEIHIITNAWEVETKYREKIESEDLEKDYQPKNVYVWNTDPFINPRFIPYFTPYTEKLVNKSIEVIEEYGIDVIDSWYLLPYGIAGFLAKAITGKPLIIRHAGSDIGRLFNSPSLRTLFIRIFERTDKIVTYPNTVSFFRSLGIPKEKIFINRKVSVNTEIFTPEGPRFILEDNVGKKMEEVPVITYIGKLSRAKGVYELVEAIARIKEEFLLLFVTQNKDLKEFQEFVRQKGLKKKTVFLGFLPPWKIPSIIRSSTCVVVPERDFPIPHHMPILPREVIACGRCLILSKELYEKYKKLGFEDKENCIVVNPKDIPNFRMALELVIKNEEIRNMIAQNGLTLSKKIENFEEYIKETLTLYYGVI